MNRSGRIDGRCVRTREDGRDENINKKALEITSKALSRDTQAKISQ